VFSSPCFSPQRIRVLCPLHLWLGGGIKLPWLSFPFRGSSLFPPQFFLPKSSGLTLDYSRPHSSDCQPPLTASLFAFPGFSHALPNCFSAKAHPCFHVSLFFFFWGASEEVFSPLLGSLDHTPDQSPLFPNPFFCVSSGHQRQARK